jgi:uncharacterized protein
MGALCCCCKKRGPPTVEPDDGCWESFLDFVVVGRKRDRLILMERRRAEKWKRVDFVKSQDYLIAGANRVAEEREIEAEKFFEQTRSDQEMNKDYPEDADFCCQEQSGRGWTCEELWEEIDLARLTYEFLYACCERHNLDTDGTRLMLETRINKWRRAPQLERERREEKEKQRRDRYDLEAGTVYAFGRNEHGQLGLGNIDEKFVRWPSAIPSMKNKGVSTVYAGFDASVGVAVNDDGDVFIWGDCNMQIANPERQQLVNSADGRLENYGRELTIEECFRYSTDVDTVREETFRRFKELSLQFSDHQIDQFGMKDLYFKYGEYLNGRMEKPTLTDFKPFLDLSGEIEKWRGKYAGWLPEDVAEREKLPPNRAVATPFVLESLRGEDVRSVAIGKTVDKQHVFLCVVEGGDFYSAGTNSKAQLGYEVNEISRLPITCHKRMPPLEIVACGQEHAAAVTANGVLLTWGHSKEGKLGHGILKRLGIEYPRNFLFAPGPVRGCLDRVKVSKVSCGRVHTVAVTATFDCFSWGSGAGYRLGHGNLESIDMPKRIETLSELSVLDVACAGWYTIVLVGDAPAPVKNSTALKAVEREDGAIESPGTLPAVGGLQLTMVGLYSWGSGTDGQLGQGRQASEIPRPIQSLLDQRVVPIQFSCGENHAAMLSEEGQIWTWGHISGIGRAIALRNDIVSMKKSRGGYVIKSPARRLREPLSDPFPAVVETLCSYPIGNATSVACGLDFTIVAVRRCFDEPPPKPRPLSPRRGRDGLPITAIPRQVKKQFATDILEAAEHDGKGTIIDIAKVGGKPDIIQIQLSQGADVDLCLETNGDTALIVASRLGNGPSVEILLRYGANVHIANNAGRTALEESVEQKRWDCIRAFFNHRSFKHSKNLTLRYAARRGYNDVVAFALEYGAYIDYIPETDTTLATPIMWAARNGHKDTVRLLYENGSNIELQTITDERAIDFARIQGFVDIANMLQRWTRKRSKDRVIEMRGRDHFATPREEDDREAIRSMQLKIHPACNQCLLQNWKDRKQRKEGWCPGFEGMDYEPFDVWICKFCRHHFKEHRWKKDHPLYIKYIQRVASKISGLNEMESSTVVNISSDGLGEIGGEIIVQDIHQYSEEYLQAMAEQ